MYKRCVVANKCTRAVLLPHCKLALGLMHSGGVLGATRADGIILVLPKMGPKEAIQDQTRADPNNRYSRCVY
jgi:hypothetical protein